MQASTSKHDSSTGRTAKRVVMVFLGGLAVGAAPFLGVSAAVAAPPEHGHLDSASEFDDTEYCADEGVSSFHVVETATLDFTVLRNADGSLRQVIAHHTQHDTFTANGKTLQEDDRWTDFFYPDGHSVTVGAHTHIRGDTGIVLRDAGRIVEAADGSIEFVAGKHPQFFGATFCQELLP